MAAEREIEAIVLGGSIGAFDALLAILAELPDGYSLPMALVVHLPPSRPTALPSLLAARCSLSVKEAEDKEHLAAGTVYVAPPNYHLLIERDRSLSLSADDPVHFSRPSIDVLFESAADAFGSALAGVLLTGGNEDGARGLASIGEAGGMTIVQSPDSAVVATMPQAALRLTHVDHVLPPREIGRLLRRLHDH